MQKDVLALRITYSFKLSTGDEFSIFELSIPIINHQYQIYIRAIRAMARIIGVLSSVDEVIDKYDRISVTFEDSHYDVYKSLIVRWKIKDQNHPDSAIRTGNVPNPEEDETVSDISVFLKEQSTKGAKIYVYIKGVKCEIILKP